MKKPEPVLIASLEVENTKRVEFVMLKLDAKAGLTVLGGDNAQGKSSTIDAGRWLFGGDRYKPAHPVRDGAERVNIVAKLNNGMVVERVGKNGTLRVTTKDGQMGGQQYLKSFVNDFSLDIQAFMDLTDKEKAKALLNALGVDLAPIEAMEKEKYDERTSVGRSLERAKAYAASLPYHEGAKEVSADAVMAKINEAMSANAEYDEVEREYEKAQSAHK